MAGMVPKSMSTMAVAVIFVAWAIPQGDAIDCTVVVQYLNPCLPYLTDQGALGGCCSGVKDLYDAAKTPEDRQSVCSCLKSIYGLYSTVDMSKASGLPGECGVSVPYKISPSIDCSTYAFSLCICLARNKYQFSPSN